MKSIYIYGAGGHGLVVADIASSCGYEKVIFIDDRDNEFLTFEQIKHDINTPVALGIGANLVRKLIFNKLTNSGFEIVSLIHPSSIISKSAIIKNGTVIMPLVVVNANAIIGEGSILNSGSTVEHECTIGNFVHISPSVALAGGVDVGELTHIGIGSSVIQGVKIGVNCIIGAGSTVLRDITNNKKAFGNPCKEIGEIV